MAKLTCWSSTQSAELLQLDGKALTCCSSTATPALHSACFSSIVCSQLSLSNNDLPTNVLSCHCSPLLCFEAFRPTRDEKLCLPSRDELRHRRDGREETMRKTRTCRPPLLCFTGIQHSLFKPSNLRKSSVKSLPNMELNQAGTPGPNQSCARPYTDGRQNESVPLSLNIVAATRSEQHVADDLDPSSGGKSTERRARLCESARGLRRLAPATSASTGRAP